MDWTSIIMALLGGSSALGILGAIVYRKENKKLKQNEVKVSTVDAQKQEIELAEMYKDKMLDLLEQVSSKQESGNENQTRILQKLDTLDSRMDKMDGKVADIVAYLNGDFQDFLERQHGPRKKQPKTA